MALGAMQPHVTSSPGWTLEGGVIQRRWLCDLGKAINGCKPFFPEILHEFPPCMYFGFSLGSTAIHKTRFSPYSHKKAETRPILSNILFAGHTPTTTG